MEPDAWSFRTSLEECLKVFCPECGSRPGTTCVRERGMARTAQHEDRHEAARLRGAKPVISKEEWAANKRWISMNARGSRANYSNLRRDGW